MKATLAPTSVADFCQDLIDGKTVVNRDYQRDDRVWSSYVRSYFIESILLEFPIPKIFLYVKYDLRNKTSIKEIVDGQQRSQALKSFYENRMKISTKIETEEFRGKRYKDLADVYQGKFLSYSLAVDEFSGVSEDEIRESFARMNVHNATLNSEELRNAKFQGSFKFFVIHLARAFREALLAAAVISRRDIIRMADTRMLAEAVYILDKGFRTTKPQEIDAIYREYEAKFPQEEDFQNLLTEAFEGWYKGQLRDIDDFNRKHIFYTNIAAMIELNHPGRITAHLSPAQRLDFDRICSMNIDLDGLVSSLAAAREEDTDVVAPEFVEACSTKTNVDHQKLIRFSYVFAAITKHE